MVAFISYLFDLCFSIHYLQCTCYCGDRPETLCCSHVAASGIRWKSPTVDGYEWGWYTNSILLNHSCINLLVFRYIVTWNILRSARSQETSNLSWGLTGVTWGLTEVSLCLLRSPEVLLRSLKVLLRSLDVLLRSPYALWGLAKVT